MDVLRYGRPDMTPGLSSGLLKDVVESEGAGLVGDHAAGVTVLEVSSGGFREAGSCEVAGVTYAYTRDGDSLTITPALTAAAEDGDPVLSLAPDGSVETAKVAVVDVDQDGDPEDDIWADIPGELASFYPFGTDAAGAIVNVRDTPYGYEVASRPVDAPTIDSSFITTPYIMLYLAADSAAILNNTLTPVTTWTRSPDSAMFGAEWPDASGWVQCGRTGFWRVEAFADWAANTSGGRQIVVEKKTLAGATTVLRRITISPASGGSGTNTVSETYLVTAGESLRISVAQFSGGGLALEGDPTGTQTAFKIIWDATR